MDEMEMRQKLEEAASARARKAPWTGASSWESVKDTFTDMHDLAEAQYQPARAFFESCLGDLDRDWRLEAVRDIGFHYDLREDEDVLEKLRRMLVGDPDPGVRLAVAAVLGSQSSWPDWALESALHDDPDKHVRRVAFEELLRLVGMPDLRVGEHRRKLEQGEIQPTWEQLEKGIAEAGIGLQTPALASPDG